VTGPAIVIFGAAVRADGRPSNTMRRRVDAAVVFGETFPESFYVPTGGVGRHGEAEATAMVWLLTGLRVPRERILQEMTAKNTLSSVRAVRRLLRKMEYAGPVYAATSAYHLPRCLLLMRIAGLPARACPPPKFPPSAVFWKAWYWRLREIAALPVDAALMLYLRLSGRL
jgi:uncharacterized SAM-binding protein YcdF (DUF218 family)